MEFRPSKIEELFGQDHLKPILSEWFTDVRKIPQSILMHGPYGTGKTSIARMIAEKLATNPTDINEMNAAASRGIDDIRDLADSTMFSGLGGNKVYIVDELHQMTPAAQSALLKVIEEPKPGIYFILCTTDFAKLLDTIRSRCTKLEVRLLDETNCFALMNYLNPNLSQEIKEDIYYSSGGHARDIVKAVAIGTSNPTVIIRNASDIRSAFDLVGKWFNGENVDWFKILNMDEQSFRSICDHFCDNPTMLGMWFKFDVYDKLLQKRADSLLYLITQKQRFIHLMMVRY